MLSNIALQYGQKPAFGGNADIVGDTLTQLLDFMESTTQFIDKFNPFTFQHPLQERENAAADEERNLKRTLLDSLQPQPNIQHSLPGVHDDGITKPAQIKARRFNRSVDAVLPAHWFGESPFMTHVLNSWNVMFPAAERYFVRWSKRALERVDDPVIRKNILGFIGQETQHATQHEKLWGTLEQQGYNVQPLMTIIDEFLFGVLERAVPDSWNYSSVAAFEHFTALFAEIYFETPQLMDRMHPDMQALFEWHAAEEIEHKAVAFDQLMAVNDNYFLRTGIMNFAVVILYSLTIGHSFYLMWQDDSIFDVPGWMSDVYELFGKYDVAQKTMVKFLEYYRPDFHPWNNENYHMARQALDQAFAQTQTA